MEGPARANDGVAADKRTRISLQADGLKPKSIRQK